jgi:methylase of polypeptide subunit release factors
MQCRKLGTRLTVACRLNSLPRRAIDVNPRAVEATRGTAARNSVDVEVRQGDLHHALRREELGTVRLFFHLPLSKLARKGTLQLSPPTHAWCPTRPRLLQIDVLLFNPPYVVTPSEEVCFWCCRSL